MSGSAQWFDDDSPAGRAAEWVSKWYHVVVVMALFTFMFWVRARTWGRFVIDGRILFRGNDPWYHLREISYTVTNWPWTMPFDVWTEFPFGTSAAQFGTLFDQMVATTALVVGLGSPSDHLVRLVHLFAPAVFGAAMVVPTYYLGKKVGNRVGGVVAALVVALSAGLLLNRSQVGFSDHQVVEAFFQAIAVLTILLALHVAQAEKPIYELFVDRDYRALRRPIGWGVIAGAATAVYISIWPPGVLLVGILGVYVTIQLPIAHLRGESPEHVGIAVGTIFLTVAVLSLAALDTADLSLVKMSLAQPLLSLAGILWIGFLSWLARFWDRRDLEGWQYPATVLGLLLVGTAVLLLVVPDLFWYFVDQTLRFVGFTVNPTAAASTVAEVQPLKLSEAGQLIQWLGTAPIVAGAGVLLVLAHQYFADELEPELLFVALWFLFFVAATFTQRRFGYYLTVPAATVSAFVVGRFFEYVRSFGDGDGVETYQVLVVAGIVLTLVVPLLFPFPGAAVQASANNGPGGIQGWTDSLEWLQHETPAVGNLGGAGNADQMALYGTYERTEDFDYPPGAYGVMSWWDYGHWISEEGERIPVANPFQGNAREAAAFLMAQNESAADARLADVSEGPDTPTRYIMVDWKMATANPGFGPYRWGKFFAPSNFLENRTESDYYRRIRGLARSQGQQRGRLRLTGRYFTVQTQDYYETMAVRLYRYHGSRASVSNPPGIRMPRNTIPVVDWRNTEVELQDGRTPTWHLPARTQNGSVRTLRYFRNRTAAEQFVQRDGTAQIGGIGKIPSEPVPALQHYRLVQTSNTSYHPLYGIQPGLTWLIQNRFETGVSQQAAPLIQEPYHSWTKVFERVPGATIRGQGPANQTVVASVRMNMPGANRTFTYRQRAQTGPDGQFTLTVPYSTTGYENWGPAQGYTNVSVRATTPYQITAAGGINDSGHLIQYSARVEVPEANVIGEAEGPIEVTLEEQSVGRVTGGGNESSSEAVEPRTPETDGSTGDSGARTAPPTAVGTPSVRIVAGP